MSKSKPDKPRLEENILPTRIFAVLSQPDLNRYVTFRPRCPYVEYLRADEVDELIRFAKRWRGGEMQRDTAIPELDRILERLQGDNTA